MDAKTSVAKEWEGLISGNETIIKAVYKQAYKEITPFLMHKYQLTQEEAEDIFQDSFVKLYSDALLGKFKDTTFSINAYLYRLINSRAVDLIRKKIQFIPEGYEYEDSVLQNMVSESIENSVPDQEAISYETAVQEVLQGLNDTEKEIITKYYFDGKTTLDISAEINLSTSRISNTLSDFKRKVVRFLRSS